MEIPRLRSKFLNNKSEENRVLYVKQRNYCVFLLKKSKNEYYEYLNEKGVLDNKIFKIFQDLNRHCQTKFVPETDRFHLICQTVKKGSETAQVLNNFFPNIVKSLQI